MRLLSKLILIYLVIELAIFLGVSAIPSNSPSTYQQYNSLESSVQNTTYLGKVLTIFPHNLLVATIDFIPIIGIAFFGMSIADTGYVVSVVSTHYGIPGILAGVSLLLLPHSAVELPSYAIAVGAGTYMVIRWRDWKRSLLTYIVVPVELFFAALIESSLFYLSDPFIMWLASIPVLIGIYFLYQKIQKYADKISIPAPTQVGYSDFSRSQPYYNQFYSLYKESWNRGAAYEAEGQIQPAIDSYWSGILYLLDAIAVRLGLPYISKEDLYRVVQVVSNYYPNVFTLFNKVQADFQVSRDPLIISDLKSLAMMLENAYFNPTIRP
mgnify:CR=1 FL=1